MPPSLQYSLDSDEPYVAPPDDKASDLQGSASRHNAAADSIRAKYTPGEDQGVQNTAG